MKRTLVTAAALLLMTGLIVFAGPAATQFAMDAPVYGFGVDVLPDEEFDDFVQCGLTVFTLEGEEHVAQLPRLRIMTGDANSMTFRGIDDVEVTFKCAINADKTEATYEIAGTREGRLVMNHLATVRFH